MVYIAPPSTIHTSISLFPQHNFETLCRMIRFQQIIVRVHDQSYCAVLEYVTLHEVDRLTVET
jgi:hypothetical protein